MSREDIYIGIESNGKIYELGNGGVFAFSKRFVSDKKVFLKAGSGTVCFIAALAEQHYQLNPEKPSDPFFHGRVTLINYDKSKIFCREERRYIDASSYYTVNSAFDRNGQLLLAYNIDVSAIFEQFFRRELNYSVDEEKKIIRLIL